MPSQEPLGKLYVYVWDICFYFAIWFRFHVATCSESNPFLLVLSYMYFFSPFIYQLQQLEVLAANGNFLSGSIPFMVDRLKNLRVLYLDSNELSGTIPSSLPPNLVELYLSKNALQGRIPESISKLHHLEKLILHDNLLGGPNAIPKSLGSIPSLKKMYLHENSFKGEVPKEVCDLRYLNLMDFSSDCGGNPAEIECFCCTSCF